MLASTAWHEPFEVVLSVLLFRNSSFVTSFAFSIYISVLYLGFALFCSLCHLFHPPQKKQIAMIASNTQPTAYEAVHAALLGDLCSLKDQLQNLPTDIAFRNLEQREQLIHKSLEPRTIDDSDAFDTALLAIQKFKETQKMDLERSINGPDGVLELVMRCLTALETAEAEVASLTLAWGLTSGLTSLGGGARDMGNYEEINMLRIRRYQGIRTKLGGWKGRLRRRRRLRGWRTRL